MPARGRSAEVGGGNWRLISEDCLHNSGGRRRGAEHTTNWNWLPNAKGFECMCGRVCVGHRWAVQQPNKHKNPHRAAIPFNWKSLSAFCCPHMRHLFFTIAKHIKFCIPFRRIFKFCHEMCNNRRDLRFHWVYRYIYQYPIPVFILPVWFMPCSLHICKILLTSVNYII